MNNIAIIIISSLISGTLGVVISLVYYRRHEKYQGKINTLKSFVGYRYDLKGEHFTKTLNEIFVVFHDSEDVLNALSKFHEITVSRQTALGNDALIKLFKAMCKDLKIDPSKYSESFFLSPFNTAP